MALLKKGSRTIVVDGEVYRWRIRAKPTYAQLCGQSNLLLAVEHAAQSGSKLVVEFPHPHPSSWMSIGAVPVLPSDVERFVQAALQAGWQPTQPGSTFGLKTKLKSSTAE